MKMRGMLYTGAVLAMASGCLPILGCKLRGAVTSGGTEASGFVLQGTVDDDTKQMIFVHDLVKVLQEAGMEPGAIGEHVMDYVQSKEGSWELNDLDGCMDQDARFEECFEFIKFVHAKDAPDEGTE